MNKVIYKEWNIYCGKLYNQQFTKYKDVKVSENKQNI